MWFEMSIYKFDYSNDIFRINELEFEKDINEADVDIDDIDKWLEENK